MEHRVRYTKAAAGGFAALLAVICLFSPATSVVALPLVGAAVCFLGWRWLPVAAASVYALVSALLYRGNSVALAGAVWLLSLCVPLCCGKLSTWQRFAVAAGCGAAAVGAFFGLRALIAHTAVRDAIADAYASLSADPLVAFVSQRQYRKQTAETLGYAPLAATDAGYATDAARVFAARIGRELDGNALWYVSGYGAFASGTATAVAAALAQFARLENAPRMQDLRLGKNYLFAAVLPALAFMLFYFYEPMRPVVRTVVNLLITLPCALCGITLLYHSALRFRGGARIAALVVFWLLLAASVLFWEYGLLLLGFLGLADCIMNVRALLDWALG